MVQLFSGVNPDELDVKICPGDSIAVMGSCFADNMAEKLINSGFDICANPFGTLYNPLSIAAAIQRLDSCRDFEESDCIQMGSGSELICSFSHHTSFARPDVRQFLDNANNTLTAASNHWKRCSKVIITLGTARVWKHIGTGAAVANCLKRPAAEFSHEMLSTEAVAGILHELVSTHPDKQFIFTVSPIRNLGLGAHDNAISKATLILGAESARDRSSYFPAYEILLDELRDYRFYAEDLVHPSKTAVEIIWERFVQAAVPPKFHEQLRENARAARRQAHRPMR